MGKIDEFRKFRGTMNNRILETGDINTRRFFSLDSAIYREGVLDAKTKELLGLVASMVLRCDDCVTYHILQCKELGISRAEFMEAFNVALIVGGSIVIPHFRRAVALLDELKGVD